MVLWDAEEAIDKITLDGLLDLTSIMNDPDWPIRANFSHTIASRVGAIARGRGLAKVSIKIGEIKDPDTALNWISWAESRGYSVNHLRNEVNPANLPGKAQKEEKIVRWEDPSKWEYEARKIGKEYFEKNKEKGIVAIAAYVEGELSNRNILGARGKYLDRETIRREALPGITGRKPNGRK